MNDLGITKTDEEKFLQILEDVQKSVSCEIGIAGSLAQRILSPTVATLLQGKPLRDIDLLLIVGIKEPSPELPLLRKSFRVLEVIHDKGWYYGMSHKQTVVWVDLFTPPYEQHFALVTIKGKEYKVNTLENQILYLAYDILSRSKRGVPVRKKWIEKLKLLNSLPEINKVYIRKEYELHIDYFRTIASEITSELFIQKALNIKHATWLQDKWFLLRWYFFFRNNKV